MKKWIALVWFLGCFCLFQNASFAQEKLNIFSIGITEGYLSENSIFSKPQTYGISYEHVFKKKEASMFSYQLGVMYGKPVVKILDGNTLTTRNQAFDIGVLIASLNYSLGKRNSKLILSIENAFRYGNTPFMIDIGRNPTTYDAIVNVLKLGVGYRLLSLKSGLFIQLIFKLPIIGIANIYSPNLNIRPDRDVFWEWGGFNNNESIFQMGGDGSFLSFGWALPALKRTKYPKE